MFPLRLRRAQEPCVTGTGASLPASFVRAAAPNDRAQQHVHRPLGPSRGSVLQAAKSDVHSPATIFVARFSLLRGNSSNRSDGAARTLPPAGRGLGLPQLSRVRWSIWERGAAAGATLAFLPGLCNGDLRGSCSGELSSRGDVSATFREGNACVESHVRPSFCLGFPPRYREMRRTRGTASLAGEAEVRVRGTGGRDAAGRGGPGRERARGRAQQESSTPALIGALPHVAPAHTSWGLTSRRSSEAICPERDRGEGLRPTRPPSAGTSLQPRRAPGLLTNGPAGGGHLC